MQGDGANSPITVAFASPEVFIFDLVATQQLEHADTNFG